MNSPNDKKDIIDLLNYLDENLKSNVILVFMGGTALTLLGEKELSNDIDVILYSAEDKEEFFEKYFEGIKVLKLTQGEHPPYEDFDVGLMDIKDYFEKSEPLQGLKYKHITAYTMSILDIIISKNFRALPKDKQDIVKLLQKRQVSKASLQQRYLELSRQQHKWTRQQFEEKFKNFLTDFGHLLK
jgi:hypothetical protein